jgi:hypothetical protein
MAEKLFCLTTSRQVLLLKTGLRGYLPKSAKVITGSRLVTGIYSPKIVILGDNRIVVFPE